MVVDIHRIETVPILETPNVIQIGYNLSDYIATEVIATVKVSNYVIITDNNLAPLYLSKLLSSFHSQLKNGTRLLARILAAGEKSKSRNTKESIEDYLLDESCTRDTCLIALGGGVIGDLVGYVASTFMRGIPFVQIPTTLLSMVDSSIGGKTAVDTPHGKNLIGTFWQPRRIFLDLCMLATLPKREIANGMAEIIKVIEAFLYMTPFINKRSDDVGNICMYVDSCYFK
jgi:3-dehydroquinate synthetase